jgi:hypothetical protein
MRRARPLLGKSGPGRASGAPTREWRGDAGRSMWATRERGTRGLLEQRGRACGEGAWRNGICNASARGFRKMRLGMGWRGRQRRWSRRRRPTRAGVSPGAGAAGWVGASQGDTTMRRPYEIWAAISGGIVSGARRSRGIVWVRGRGRGRTARCARLHTVLIE